VVLKPIAQLTYYMFNISDQISLTLYSQPFSDRITEKQVGITTMFISCDIENKVHSIYFNNAPCMCTNECIWQVFTNIHRKMDGKKEELKKTTSLVNVAGMAVYTGVLVKRNNDKRLTCYMHAYIIIYHETKNNVYIKSHQEIFTLGSKLTQWEHPYSYH